MGATAIIPARYDSSRYPGKPLVAIAGRPMIEHVWRGAQSAERLSDVVVATDDDRIAAACEGFGARWVVTRSDHATGSDRLAEAADLLGLDDSELVVNVQGDEPLIEGRVIDAVVDALRAGPDAVASTAVHRAEPEALADPNRVKVVLDQYGHALYFSRQTIPAVRNPDAAPTFWQHIGIYAYRREFLRRFVSLARTPAERAEELEQLRILEHGHRMRAAIIEGWTSQGVDTPEDRDRVEALLRK